MSNETKATGVHPPVESRLEAAKRRVAIKAAARRERVAAWRARQDLRRKGGAS